MKDPDKALLALRRAQKDRDSDALIDLLRDPKLRDVAARTLGEMGEQRAITYLRPLLNAADPYARSASVRVLGSLGDRSVLPQLREIAVSDPQDFVRAWAIDAVGKLGGHTELDFLVRLLDDPDLMVRTLLRMH